MTDQSINTRYGAIPRLEKMPSSDDMEAGNHNNNNTTSPFGSPLIRTLSESMQTLAQAQFHLSAQALQQDDRLHAMPAAGTATISSEVANMTKNLIGGGVLSLSGGMALFANNATAASLAAMYWVVILGAVLGYFCLLIGKACDMSLSGTYRECWERTVGHRGGLLVAVMNTLDPLLGIFANASILAQSLQLLLEGMNVYMTVVECLLLITGICLLPLCLMKNLSALAPFSTMGMAAVLVALGCMVIRYLDGSYRPGGQYHDDIPAYLQPSFGTESRPLSIDVLPFVCMVYTSFDMHYNSPRFYAELKDASIPRYTQVVGYSFGITAVIYFSIAIVGFLTFGENSDSYILNNYSSRDALATVSRIAIGLCALVSYPLNFIGVRDNCLDILGLTDEINTVAKLNVFTLLLLTCLTVTSCFVTDLGLINSVGGGTTVTCVCFIFPAVMFRQGLLRHKQQPSQQEQPLSGKHGRTYANRLYNAARWEVWVVMALMTIGVVLGIVGVWSSLFLA